MLPPRMVLQQRAQTDLPIPEFATKSEIIRISYCLASDLYSRRVRVQFAMGCKAYLSAYSWATIQQTSNISDVELNERFRNTALYATLRAVIPREYEPECYETLRDMAELVPTPAEIASRWPGLSPDQTEALVQDYRMECDQLGQLDLNDIYHRVRELAAQDIGWEGAP